MAGVHRSAQKTVENRRDTVHKSDVRYIKTGRAPNITLKWVVGCWYNYGWD